MSKSLFFQAVVKFLSGAILIGLLIFLSAGTIAFWKGWLLMAILLIPMFLAGIVMMLKNPELLESACMSGSSRRSNVLWSSLVD